jgi:excisionase family DNA binding protein
MTASRSPIDRRSTAHSLGALGDWLLELDAEVRELRALVAQRPQEPDAAASRAPDLLFMNTTEAASYAGRHRETILHALEAGELHGLQRKARGRWRIRRECLDAWLSGTPCSHASGAQ